MCTSSQEAVQHLAYCLTLTTDTMKRLQILTASGILLLYCIQGILCMNNQTVGYWPQRNASFVVLLPLTMAENAETDVVFQGKTMLGAIGKLYVNIYYKTYHA